MTASGRGRLLLRGGEGYEQARVGWIFNARRPDRYPAAILEVADEEDVAAGVRLAAERGWKVSVRSGGHSWAAWSLHDDALLIDLGGLRSMSYDDATGVVSAGPATKGSLSFTTTARSAPSSSTSATTARTSRATTTSSPVARSRST